MKVQFALIAIIVVATGCTRIYPVSMPRQLPARVDEAAWLGAACATAETGPPDFRIRRKKQIGKQVIVMYTSTCRDPGPHSHRPERIIGYTSMQSIGAGWDATAGGYYVDVNRAPPTAIASDDIGYGARGELLVLFGEVFRSDQVAAVEVTLSNGHVLRDHPHNGFFLVVAPGGTNACERRLLAPDGSVLERKNVGPMIPACR